MEFPFLPEDEIDRAAACLLQEVFGGLEAVPLPVDLEAIVYDHLYDREEVAFRDDLELGSRDGDRILGKTEPLTRRILVDVHLKREGPVGRYRFTVAHEVGHWILHRPLFFRDEAQGSLFQDASGRDADLISLQRNVFPGAGRGRLPPEEWQANRFAISLLINPERLRTEFRSRFDRPFVTVAEVCGTSSDAECRALARRLALHEVGEAPPLTRVFGLSAEAMAIALEKRGYVRRDSTAL